jgi:nitrogen fixation/metabolism regulation signal transduction histidine kinase
MLYKDEFTLYAFALIATIVIGFLFLFGVAFLINKRLDTLALRRRLGSDHSKLSERLFWKIS